MANNDAIGKFPMSFVTLGMFIIDEFAFYNEDGSSIIGGGGTYAAIGARIWLPAVEVGMILDRGGDFPASIQAKLLGFGTEMWLFRDWPDRKTTSALNSYRGKHRDFEYTTPRIRITPRDMINTRLERARTLHFICSPSRASVIMSQVREVHDWAPTTIYEPIPDRCVPEELPALMTALPSISILSPNAEEALSLLSFPLPPTRTSIEQAAHRFLELGIGEAGTGCVIIRGGEMGAYVKTREREGKWIAPFWASEDDARRVVDVTGAGNSFLGGLAAGLALANGDVYEAIFYASVSASFTIEQEGLPKLSLIDDNLERWNDDIPLRRLQILQTRHRNRKGHTQTDRQQ